MALRPLSSFLLRAPLFPLSALRRPRAGAETSRSTSEWMRAALALASPSLRAAPKRGDSAAARANYARRAAFRPTPHQLWAGVAVGALGPRTRVRTGAPSAQLTVSFARLAALSRALMAHPEFREQACIRQAPSLLRAGRRIAWLTTDDAGEAATLEAEVDDALECVLELTREWRPYPEVRSELRHRSGVDEDLDEYLQLLLEDRLLLHDFEPPLIGPPPLAWMRRRLQGRLPELDEVAELLDDEERPLEIRIDEARRLLERLPGDSGSDPGSGSGSRSGAQSLHAILCFTPPTPPTLSHRAVERAAALAPLLFALKEALSPPASERDLDGALAPALDAITELFGCGAIDLASLSLGDYGVRLVEGDRPVPATPPTLFRFLVDQLLGAATRGESELALRAEELMEVVPPGPMPPTFELFLVPMKERRGRPPGTGWLLGLHAPAGASLGRFAHALGAPMTALLDELGQAERHARPFEENVDVAFSPSPSLADLTAHPPIRARHLALTSWGESEAISPAELALVADGAALDPLTLRAGSQPVAPGPLHRLRAQTAPEPYRLLCGYSLFRQHAPWALQLGPLDALCHLPRISIDGFVVAPASWAIPAHLDSAGALARWRREQTVPRRIQIGLEDELLPIDLDDPTDVEMLLGRAPERRPRAYEIWPPIDASVDEDGRRVEAVVAVIDEPDEAEAARLAHAAQRTSKSGGVPPPRCVPPNDDWRTYKLFSAADRIEHLLLDHVAPVVRRARAADQRCGDREDNIDGWFFLRYVDGPGPRDHLRLRVKAATQSAHHHFYDALTAALREPLQAGDLVSIEQTPYHRELSRYGGEAAMAVVEKIWEIDSDLSCAILAEPDEARLLLGVCGFDGLATGLGLSAAERLAAAESCVAAYAHEVEEARARLTGDYRHHQAELQFALGRAPGPLFAGYITRVAAAAEPLGHEERRRLLPALLHLSAVRTWGRERMDEIRALYLWQRTLFGLSRRTRK